jgi:hypothetical protein
MFVVVPGKKAIADCRHRVASVVLFQKQPGLTANWRQFIRDKLECLRVSTLPQASVLVDWASFSDDDNRKWLLSLLLAFHTDKPAAVIVILFDDEAPEQQLPPELLRRTDVFVC